jgi:hypothetical protein
MSDPAQTDTRQADPQGTAEAAVRRAEEEARKAEEEAERALRGVRDHAEGAVRDTARIAREESNARVSGAFDDAAREAERAAAAAEDAAGEYDPGAMPARALESVSMLLEDTARGLRESDLDSVAHTLRDVARKNPVTFLAGAAALGFAAGRLARASDPRGAYDTGDGDVRAAPRGGSGASEWERRSPTSAADTPAPDPDARPVPPRSAAAPGAPGMSQAEAGGDSPSGETATGGNQR